MTTFSTHNLIDRRSIGLHKQVAQKILNDPSLIEKVKNNLDNLIAKNNQAKKYFEEWKILLDYKLEDLLAKLTEESEKMNALRQSSPFFGILTPQERWKVYESFRT